MYLDRNCKILHKILHIHHRHQHLKVRDIPKPNDDKIHHSKFKLCVSTNVFFYRKLTTTKIILAILNGFTFSYLKRVSNCSQQAYAGFCYDLSFYLLKNQFTRNSISLQIKRCKKFLSILKIKLIYLDEMQKILHMPALDPRNTNYKNLQTVGLRPNLNFSLFSLIYPTPVRKNS